MGFVAKENFDEDEREQYYKEKETNPAITEKKLLEAKMKEEAAKAYEDWIKVTIILFLSFSTDLIGKLFVQQY